MTPLRIAVTPGEPAGIGPDILIQLCQQPHAHQLVAVADPQLLERRARILGLPLQLRHYQADAEIVPDRAGELSVLPVSLQKAEQAGQLDAANAPYVLETLKRAADGCLQNEFAALVTGPVHKGIINEAGIPFTGHTEFLAERTHTPKVVMMLATPGLRVALVTTHMPLRQVADAITREELERSLRILHHDLQTYFGLQSPHILICGLNPHAGEDGHLGGEERDIMIPLIQQLVEEGMNLHGPLPADTLFTEHSLEQADAVLAMYHDQGLPVLKHKGFGHAVNVTLGLPIIRTSVDHGTALELAGTGKAGAGSMQYAIEVAVDMAGHRLQS